MGFFNKLAGAVGDANDDAHGHRLLTEVQSTFSIIPTLDKRVQHAMGLGYLQIVERLVEMSAAWSPNERIKLGRLMQGQAREKFDVDVSGSYAKWMAGAWLESGDRKGVKAQQAYALLGGLADTIAASGH